LETHSFIWSSVGALVWLFRRSINPENVNELPPGGFVETEVSEFINVDKAGLRKES